MTEAQHAVRAARNVKSWGRFAARRYCERRGVHPALYRIARQLEAADRRGKRDELDLLAVTIGRLLGA